MTGYIAAGLILVLDLIVFFAITKFYVPAKGTQVYHFMRLGFFLPIVASFLVWFVSVLNSMRQGWVIALSITPWDVVRRSESPFWFWFSAIIELIVVPYMAIYILNMLF